MKKNLYRLIRTQMLAVAVFVLWSIGCIITPLLREVGRVSTELSHPLLSVTLVVYVVLHVALFGYVLQRLPKLLRRRAVWELIFCAYILLALASSLYFIAYESGYLPAWMPNVMALVISTY